MASEDRRGVAPLHLTDATLLAHSLGSLVGQELSVRVLSIKGPAADHHALRPARISVDADLLVEPAQFRVFCAALEARGWHERVARSTPSILEPHSRTYIHPEWPCDIDVHERFPGFFASPGAVFDELWSRREALTIGNAVVAIPSLSASAVIGALHALRNMSDPRHSGEWRAVLDALNSRFSYNQRMDFLRLAEVGRARWVLRDAIAEMSVGPVENDLEPDEAEAWTSNLRFGSSGGAVGWIMALRQKTLAERALLLVRAVWVPKELVPRNEESARLSTTEVLRYQMVRWQRGVRATARYLAARRIRSRERDG
jgi:hypothetical protein